MEYKFNVLPSGTRLSGLVSDTENEVPRQCDKCVWYKHDFCHNVLVMADPEVLGTAGQPKPVGDKWCCNAFQSYKRTLLYALRHGEDKDDDKIGGWDDPDLDTQGVRDAKEAAEFLKTKGIRMIYSSDLDRAKQTAIVVARILGINPDSIVYDFRLRTWDKGYLNGANKTDENKAIIRHFKDNPHLVIKGGESRVMFEERVQEAFESYVDDARTEGVKLVVTHNSDIRELQLYIDDTLDSDQPDSVLPGGIIQVSLNEKELVGKVVLKNKGAITESAEKGTSDADHSVRP